MPTPRRYATAAQRQAAYRLRCQTRAQAGGSTPAFPTQPGRRRWKAMCARATELLTQVQGEMEAYQAGRPEAWPESARGEAFGELLEAVTELAAASTEVQSL
jgi:hypothetical protein